MKILVLTRGAWRADNNTGNTLIDLFSDFDGCEFFNIALRGEAPQNDLSERTFKISETDLFKNIFSKQKIGDAEAGKAEAVIYRLGRKRKNVVFSILRDLLWALGGYKNKKFANFIKECSPDIIFMPVFGFCYPYGVLKHAVRLSKAKTVLYHTDDCYGRLSPYGLRLRHHIRAAVKSSALNFGISEKMCREYGKIFSKKFYLKTKRFSLPDFSVPLGWPPYKIAYCGNLSYSRQKTLALFSHALAKINEKTPLGELTVCTNDTLLDKSKFHSKTSFLSLPASGVLSFLNEADILLLAESFKRSHLREVRLSFSTKTTDYINSGKCIIACGRGGNASFDFLSKNNAGYLLTDKKNLNHDLLKLLSDRAFIQKISDAVKNTAQKYSAADRAAEFQKLFYDLTN